MKIKLFDKQKSLEAIIKMPGYDDTKKPALSDHKQLTAFLLPDNKRN